MSSRDPPSRAVETVCMALEILEYLKSNQGATLSETAERMDIAKSTVHRHLKTLQHKEYIVEEGGQYYPSLLYLDYGIRARNRQAGYEMAKKKVDELAANTNERSQFIVEEYGQSVYIYNALGDRAVRTHPSIGTRDYLHAGAAGKAILAFLPRERAEDILDYRGLPEFTEHTITNRDLLFEELEAIRDQGYAINRQENVQGLRAVGAPILTPNDDVIGSISISGPIQRMKGEWFDEELPAILLETINELELNITHIYDTNDFPTE